MDRAVPPAILFYREHPISEEQVLDALRRQGKDLGKLSLQDLYHWNQDHYGGLAAVEALTRRAGISAESHVLDICAGLAGPARFMASQCAARVTCVDLSPERTTGARRLTALVRLGGLVRVVRAERGILRQRLEMFRGLRAQTVARLGARRYDEYNQLYAFFVGLVESRKLGGARFSATAGPGIS